uniref:Proteasome alpha-type subunits domain-containing protein n=1 Tax=Neovison vison TaxID=452646 RepID=A0A8C7A9L7_NEOVI
VSSVGAGYKLSASTFCPDGRVFQVVYAIKAVNSKETYHKLPGPGQLHLLARCNY